MPNFTRTAHNIINALKPKCVISMEKSLCKLQTAADETILLVKKNGHALERASIPQNKNQH